MTVATFTQPDNTSQTGATYKGAIDHSIMAMKRLADMFAPHQVATPNMTVQIDAGHVFDGTTLTELAQQTSATITAPSGNPRRDLVYIGRSTGVIGVATGTEAASPADPALPANTIPIARVALTVGQTTITNADLTDLRNLSHLGLSPLASTTIGIAPRQAPTNDILGNLAYGDSVDPGDIRGSASKIVGLGTDGIGAEVSVGAGLALSGNTLYNNATAGRWITINTYTPSGAATVDVAGFSAATYIDYMLIIDRVSPGTDNQPLRLLTSTNGGSSFDSGVSDYSHVGSGASIGSGAYTAGANATSYIDLSGAAGVGNAANEFISGRITMVNPGAAAYFNCIWHLGFQTAAGNYSFYTGYGARLSATAVDAVRILFASGNISGTIRLLGRLP